VVAAAAGKLPAREAEHPFEPKAVGSARAAALAQPAASALRAQSPQAVAAGEACVQAARQPEAAAGSDARVLPLGAVAVAVVASPLEAAEVAAELGVVLQPEEVAAEAARVWARQPAVAAEPVRDAEVLRQVAEAAGPQAPWEQRLAAERPAVAAGAFRPGRSLPWPGQRPEVRTAHAMWKSRAALPSKLLWQAARCEGLS
jgi:hypothetical protein